MKKSLVILFVLLFAPLCFAAEFNAVNGTVEYSETLQTFVFTPTPGFYGDASFEYEITDKKKGGQGRGRVNILVKKKNLPPVAVDDFFETEEDTPITIPVADLLINDSDPDGDEIFIFVETN